MLLRRREGKEKVLQSLSAPGYEKAEVRCKGCCGVWRGASPALWPPQCPGGHWRFPLTFPSAPDAMAGRAVSPSQSSCRGVVSCPGQPWHCQPCPEGRAQPRAALHACHIGSASATAGRFWR